MSKVIAYIVLAIFYLTAMAAAGFMFLLADNDKAGFWSIPLLVFVFFGYFYVLKHYPNNELNSIADYRVYLNSVFIIFLIMGALLLFSFLREDVRDELAYIGRTLGNGDLSVRKTLHITVIIVLIAPWIIRQVFFRTKTK